MKPGERLHRTRRRTAWVALSLLLLPLVIVSQGCEKRVTKAEKFPLMYQEQPLTILVLPPMNETTAADAKEYYATTIAEPLSLQGFYVLPIEVTSDILKNQGLYDAELLVGVPLHRFREYFGADAVLFTTIKKWDTYYAVIASSLTVSVYMVLKSTKSDQVLWDYTGTVAVDLSGGNTGTGGGLAGLIAKAVVTAVSTAMADYVPAARNANYVALTNVAFGKYHTSYNTDRAQKIIEQKSPEKESPKGEETKEQPVKK